MSRLPNGINKIINKINSRGLALLLYIAIVLLLLDGIKLAFSAERCAVIGDSIAEGIQSYFPECRQNTKIGISTPAIIARMRATGTTAELVIISAGSNDADSFGLLRQLPANLAVLRKLASGRVVWIAPINKRASEAVRAIADAHKDAIASFAPASDKVHPRNNAALASVIRIMVKGE